MVMLQLLQNTNFPQGGLPDIFIVVAVLELFNRHISACGLILSFIDDTIGAFK